MPTKEIRLGKTFQVVVFTPFVLLLVCTAYADFVWNRTQTQMTRMMETELEMSMEDLPFIPLRHRTESNSQSEFQRLIDAASGLNREYNELFLAVAGEQYSVVPPGEESALAPLITQYTKDAAPIIERVIQLRTTIDDRSSINALGYVPQDSEFYHLSRVFSFAFRDAFHKGNTELAFHMLEQWKWITRLPGDDATELEYYIRLSAVSKFHHLVLNSLQFDQWNDEQLAEMANWMKPRSEWQKARQRATEFEIANAQRAYSDTLPSLSWGEPYPFPVAPSERHQWTPVFFNDDTYRDPRDAAGHTQIRQATRFFTADRWLSIPLMDENPWSNIAWRYPDAWENERMFTPDRQQETIAKAISLRQHYRQTETWLNKLPTVEDL
ncbi:hypothetical protein Pla22_07770 [Rubripirellula amarantea]|uniref:Uncharacterized protein n=1 Tax=Rubripirellula amarantea TaxID=2527999 RepID=A0A5C5WSL3_9BACT|nr:hypothetical protein [Rubripirellula amarantea]TWT53149.1 hypothetical protein Pla22_07770 [Rubripirellula amarantea]